MEAKVRQVYGQFDKRRKSYEAKQEDLRELEELEKKLNKKSN